ncbi:hypothetical protein [Asticcacaulis sp. EMRT-3]|nr:hypothetical protein [Asticcacaulis sp. EMRT-3]MDI7774619.1 hypothetical protein [Asticcacaulis sp. EMRT-3]
MKKIVLALAVLAAAGSAFAYTQAVAHALPSCNCSQEYGCSCASPL